MLVYFMAIWHISWLFVNLVVIWYIFPHFGTLFTHFGTLYQENLATLPKTLFAKFWRQRVQ
jgi:hypothetical protein